MRAGRSPMKQRVPVVPALVFAAASLFLFSTTASAQGTIKGTVKATGLGSNADAVVYVMEVPGGSKPQPPVTMDQRQMQFLPHVLPVVAGTTVKFLNSDPTPHNVFSPDNEKYNLGTWPQGQTKDYTFSKCAKFPCVYTQLCRVHPEMEGFVVVLQNAHYAVTAKDGSFTINDVPPGSYTVGVWHAKLKASPAKVTVEAGKPATVDFTLAR
jgi:plastocyanin